MARKKQEPKAKAPKAAKAPKRVEIPLYAHPDHPMPEEFVFAPVAHPVEEVTPLKQPVTVRCILSGKTSFWQGTLSHIVTAVKGEKLPDNIAVGQEVLVTFADPPAKESPPVDAFAPPRDELR